MSCVSCAVCSPSPCSVTFSCWLQSLCEETEGRKTRKPVGTILGITCVMPYRPERPQLHSPGIVGVVEGQLGID